VREAEDLRRHLIGELEAVSSNGYLEVALSIGTVAASLIERSPWTAGVAAAGLGYLLLKRMAMAQRERATLSNHLIYAALASQHFRARSQQ
jgi:hypothetical protein